MSEKISFRFKDEERAGVLLQNEQGSLLVDFRHMSTFSLDPLNPLDYHYVEAKVRKLSPTQVKFWELGILPGSAGTVLSSASAYVGEDTPAIPKVKTDILSYLPDPKLFTNNRDPRHPYILDPYTLDPYFRAHKLCSPTLEAVVKRAQKLVCDEHQRREELARQQEETAKAKRAPIEQAKKQKAAAEKQKTIEARDTFLSTFLDSGRND